MNDQLISKELMDEIDSIARFNFQQYGDPVHWKKERLKSFAIKLLSIAKSRDFDRGYFCACGVVAREDGDTTIAASLLKQGGDGWRNADPEDIEKIREEGMLHYLAGAIEPEPKRKR